MDEGSNQMTLNLFTADLYYLRSNRTLCVAIQQTFDAVGQAAVTRYECDQRAARYCGSVVSGYRGATGVVRRAFATNSRLPVAG